MLLLMLTRGTLGLFPVLGVWYGVLQNYKW